MNEPTLQEKIETLARFEGYRWFNCINEDGEQARYLQHPDLTFGKNEYASESLPIFQPRAFPLPDYPNSFNAQRGVRKRLTVKQWIDYQISLAALSKDFNGRAIPFKEALKISPLDNFNALYEAVKGDVK